MAATYEYGPKPVGGCPVKGERINLITTFAYMPVFKGLVTYMDHGLARYAVVPYEYRGGIFEEENWLPRLDGLPIQSTDDMSYMEIFVFWNNFRDKRYSRSLRKGVLENLAPSLGEFYAKIKATGHGVGYTRLLIDDMLDTDEGPVLFLRLGSKSDYYELDRIGDQVHMITRSDLFQLRVESGEVFKHVLNAGYSLDPENWWMYGQIEPANKEYAYAKIQ